MGWMWLLIIALVIAAIIAKLRRSSRIFIIRQNFQHGENPFRNASPPPRPHIQRRGEVEQMVCCEECGIYIPDSEALNIPEKFSVAGNTVPLISHPGNPDCCSGIRPG